jgi:hypothetical protein
MERDFFGRLRCRREEHIKIDVRDEGYEAVDEVAFTKTVLNHRFH